MAFADESGFHMLPSVVRTWAPVGETPALASPAKYEHLSVASAVTLSGSLVTQIREGSFDGAGIVRFLKHLLAEIPGRIALIWDGARIHSCRAVKDFLSGGAAERLHLIRLPAYSPELNPDEGVWSRNCSAIYAHWLKHRLGNVCCMNLTELNGALRRAIRDLQHRTDIVQSFFRMAGLET